MSGVLFKKIVDKVLREDCREEGLLILTIGSENRGEWEKELKNVVDFYNKSLEQGEGYSDFNIVCMALDFAKYKLVNANLMEQRVGDSFGAIEWMFNNISDDKEED
jgi:hypothetical protein